MGFFTSLRGWVHKSTDHVKRTVHKTVEHAKRGIHKLDSVIKRLGDNQIIHDFSQKAFENNEILRDARAGYRLARNLTGIASDAINDPNLSLNSISEKLGEARGLMSKWKAL